ncbi:MAG: hypothetical protein RO257_05795 [Candidatus Kapabacteria bacterium]|nr:hypothetical protein [Candidatus Kapabacteria bacterium]
MKIVRIFEGQNNLLSFKYDDEGDNEFERLFDLWNDTEYLNKFFEDNQEYFKDSYWSTKSINELAMDTRELAGKFEGKLLEYKYVSEQKKYLEEIFEPLSLASFGERSLTKSKAKELWLRIYALKVNKSDYIITGGAIKLTRKMDDHEITKHEKEKLDKCRDYLIENGITDIEQIECIL